jgi:mannose-6-phosphate isomerase
MQWHPVQPHDFFFVPSGIVHAIGGGISLLEFQQNSDVTYRLYDYGRPRELHLDDGVSVAKAGSYDPALKQHLDGSEERTLVDGPHFTLVRTTTDALQDSMRWVLPLDGVVKVGAETAGPGECLLLAAADSLETDGRPLLIGAPC